MVLVVKKFGIGFIAMVTRPSGNVEWATLAPMEKHDLWGALSDRGCHQIDIADAFIAAEPAVRKEFQDSRHRDLVEEVGSERAAGIEKSGEDRMKMWSEFYAADRARQDEIIETWIDGVRERSGEEAADEYRELLARTRDHHESSEFRREQEEMRMRTESFIEELREQVAVDQGYRKREALALLLENIVDRR